MEQDDSLGGDLVDVLQSTTDTIESAKQAVNDTPGTVRTYDDSVTVSFSFPVGVEQDDITVSYYSDRVVVSVSGDSVETYQCDIPDSVICEDVTEEFNNGVLTVTLPKTNS